MRAAHDAHVIPPIANSTRWGPAACPVSRSTVVLNCFFLPSDSAVDPKRSSTVEGQGGVTKIGELARRGGTTAKTIRF